jgi:predicted MFS family arabinose efflux permease
MSPSLSARAVRLMRANAESPMSSVTIHSALAPAPPFHSSRVSRNQAIAMLTGASIMLSLSMGLRQSLGLFQTPLTRDLGMAASDFALAIAVQNIIWGLTQPVAGMLTDRFGARWIAIAGSLIYIAGVAITAGAHGPGAVMLGTGVLLGIALSCTSSTVAANVAARVVVPARRSLAFGIVSAAGSVGSFVCAPLGQMVIQNGGWRAGMVAFAITAVFMLPAAFIGGRADRLPNAASAKDVSMTLGSALDEARRHGGYILMCLAFFVCGLQLVFLTTHLPSYLALCGMDPSLGAQALAVIGLFNIIGSWGCGWLGERYPKRVLLGLAYLIRSLVIAVYFWAPVSPTSTLLFAAMMGLTWLGVIPLLNGLVADIFGLRYLSTLAGIAFFSHQLGSFLGAWGGGAIYDAFHSYDHALQFGVTIGVIAGLAQIVMNDRPTPRVAAEMAAA